MDLEELEELKDRLNKIKAEGISIETRIGELDKQIEKERKELKLKIKDVSNLNEFISDLEKTIAKLKSDIVENLDKIESLMH